MANTPALALGKAKFSYLNSFKIPSAIWVIGLSCFLWFTPPPVGLDLKTWHLFAIFSMTILSIILNMLPMGALACIAMTVCGITHTLSTPQILSAFSNDIMWLILLAFLLAQGFIKTGLGTRIAYYFVLRLGSSTLGLAYGLIITEFLLAPFTPSNTARGAGIVYPIARALAEEYHSTPKQHTQRKIGAYLLKLCYQTNVITSAMFLTATAGNPLISNIASQLGYSINWTTWALAAFVPGILNLAILPWILRVLYPPEIHRTPEAPKFARQKLSEMGPLSPQEWIMVGTFSLLLTLWVLGAYLHIDATLAAFIGLSILLITKVLTWEDILQEHNAWHTFIWLSALLMMSNYLTEFGMITWFSNNIQAWVHTLHYIAALGVIGFIYFYMHYAFASITAHASAMYGAFVVISIALGAPPMLVILSLAFLSSLSAGITHYGTGSAPIYFGAKYVTLKEWWRVGALLSLVNIAIWLMSGSLWWKLIGLW